MHIPLVLALGILQFAQGVLTQIRSLNRVTHEECMERCSQKDRYFPLFKPVRQGKGECSCLLCPEGRDFYKDFDGVHGCCPEGEHWSTSTRTRTGTCCKKGTHYSVRVVGTSAAGETDLVEECCPERHEVFYDPETKRSECCPADYYAYSKGRCIRRKPPGPGEPAEKPEECGQKVCATPDDLGIEYGLCYRIFNAAGKALHRYAPNAWDYTFGNDALHSHMYHFRVCRTVDDCSRRGKLTRGDRFVLHDEVGHREGRPSAGFVSGGRLAHQQLQTDPSTPATLFRLVPVCVGKDCGFCLGGGSDELPGLGMVCPVDEPGTGIGISENPRHCVPITVEKYPCLKEEWENQAGLPGSGWANQELM